MRQYRWAFASRGVSLGSTGSLLMATGSARLPGSRSSAPTNRVSTTLPSESSKSICTAYEASRSVLFVMATSTASSPPVCALGNPVMATSDVALPLPRTFFSSA